MIEKILIISFIQIAIWCFYLPGMILGKLGDWFDTHLPDWAKHIAFDCPVCGCAYYGSAAYWIIYGNSIREWIIVTFAAMGFITIFVKLKRN